MSLTPSPPPRPTNPQQRYEKLLDAACQRDEDYDPTDDPRRLRPGEIDPNPESKPARPDPVDMDEDEKEMLSEARARLANTKGKKAKRKAREKQLEEARRLASLQKRRELKAAGIETVKRAKRIQGIDYNAEIPFEKKAAPGFYNTKEERLAQEDPFNEETFKPATLAELEGPRKKDLEEQLMKQDIKRQRINERHDTPSAVQKVNELNDPSTIRRRSKLMLPTPQVSERELEDIAKMGGAGAMDLDGEGDTPGGALLSTYGQTPSRFTPAATPARTPQVGGHDVILQEAQNLRKLQTGQTPLLGGENPVLHGSDFSGITPQRTAAATPNPIAQTPGATPSRGGGPGATPSTVAGTPGRGYGGGGGVAGTPIRDSLQINDVDAMFPGGDERGAKARKTMMRNELKDGLASLPAPTNEYQIVVPELPEDDEEGAGGMDEDMDDVIAREEAVREAEHAAALRRRSKAIQRDFPRPPAESAGPAAAAGGVTATAAEDLIAAELALVLDHDAAAYPLKREKRPRAVPRIARVEEEEMEFAAELITREATAVKAAMGHADADDEYTQAAVAVRGDWIIQAETGKAIPKRSAKPADRVAAAAAEHERLRAEMERDAKRAGKLEQKVTLLTAGLQKRSGELASKLGELATALATAEEERASYGNLHEQEQRAAPRRMESLMELVSTATERERGLQAMYQTRASELAALQ
jgi:pre-mRNA-splicing factor CDC5/CEF1